MTKARGARWWSIAALGAVLVSVVSVMPGVALAPGGFPTLARFWLAAFSPDLSLPYVSRILEATFTTLAFSVLGTALAVVIGFVGGVLMSEGWWRSRTAWITARLALALPRGVHETVWAVALLLVLGRDPLVGVLAIGIPFGAITAKVYAEIIDETPTGPSDALRLAGAGKVAAFAYGTLPRVWKDFVSYAFYRLDCSLRAAVILGMLGVGGLGFELSTAFQGLAFGRMWTVMYALLLVGLACEWWSRELRDPSRRFMLGSSIAIAVLLLLSAFHLRVSIVKLDLVRIAERAARVAEKALPPTLPSTLPQLLVDCALTVTMSIAAIAVASLLGGVMAFVATPPPVTPEGERGTLHVAREALGALARAILLLVRVTSPPVWALLLLFVLFPGPLPGALALGIYNAGVLGRLYAESLETVDRRPSLALRHAGASRLVEAVYGVIPLVKGRFSAYSLYRWEVTIRESVVVGVVGAGGLGRVLEDERTAFDYSSMLTVVLALLVLSILVDLVSASARKAWR
ncbi:PhnE/PtxC family ABC transporter permease [Dermabacter vaginalis]|uniref:ABC transporter permease subunit n=1 Tax=Dermabacter vaginalis TaxID=1630135 RepID=A0ABX6A2C2_9MICO|nr:ABC transporter permease subunit [Dermabacter vaginalis]QEU11032.1 ABC transporter permease subunit [Dermabacter vaginalis]